MSQQDLAFTAELPYTGPTPDPTPPRSSDAPVRIGGSVDPARGEAYAAGFVPVVRDPDGRDRFVAADAEQHPRAVKDVAKLLREVSGDLRGLFTLEAEWDWWTGVEGVLVALLYEVNPAGAPSQPDIDKALFDALESLLARAPASELKQGLVKVAGWMETPERGAPSSLTFALASCQYPATLLDQSVARASYGRLARRLERPGKPQFLLLVGDQVYIDATAGMFDPTTPSERFEQTYQRAELALSETGIAAQLNAYKMLDDHEIVDNWEPLVYQGRPDPEMVTGRAYYLDYQRRPGPEQEAPIADSREPLWYQIKGRGLPIFVADTRTERTPRTAATFETARIMSNAQFEKILRWLSEQRDDIPKLIASPSILLPRRMRAEGCAGALRSDAWDGYPWSLHRLLAHIVEKRIRNVIFLSGDEHLSSVARAEITAIGKGESATIFSVHSSALYAPFPFANSIPDDLAGDDEFRFELEGSKYSCTVDTKFAPGDGFAIVGVRFADGKWELRCEFDRERPEESISMTHDLGSREKPLPLRY